MNRKRYRYKIIIEYDGTPYRGWQMQKNARTVQGVLLDAASDVLGASVDIQGAGRTDAGVHALAQVAHLEAHRKMSSRVILEGLNDRLPSSINVLHVEEVPLSFHARHDAQARSYLYVISSCRTAFGKRYVWWVREPLDTGKMKAACDCFRGFHNFSSFADRRRDAEASTMVHVEGVSLDQWDGNTIIRIKASHFLWRMARRMVGVIVEVGRGRLPLAEVPNMFAGISDLPARLTAPASGLFLEGIYYGGHMILPPASPVFPFSIHAGSSRLSRE